MRYYLETYIENNIEHVKIIPTAKDFEDFLTNRLIAFPLYLATVTELKWLIPRTIPEIVGEGGTERQKIQLQQPLIIRNYILEDTKCGEKYREQTLDLLTEWLEESVIEFQQQWRAIAIG